jgi:hypothetical protein
MFSFDCHDQADNSLLIPLRLVATQDENVVKSIIRGTNRQTKVEDDQFFALTDFAEQLVVAHRNLVRAVGAMFMGVPHQRLEPYYVSAFGLYKLDVNFRTQRLDPKLKAVRFHILLAMRLLANPNVLPKMNAHEMHRYCDVIQKILWDNMKADDLCAKAAKIVEKAAAGNFNRDNIRTQPFTEKVIGLCQREARRSGISSHPDRAGEART